MTQVYHHWAKVLDSPKPPDIHSIFLDWSKAFDRVCHHTLLQKLHKIGVCEQLWDWIKSFLYDRTQCVRFNGFISDFVPVTSGVPQGSILGPLLFVIYSNDLGSQLSPGTFMYLYADDTLIYRPIHTPHDQFILQLDLENIAQWSTINNMILNPDKCKVMCITRRNIIYPNYFIDDSPLDYVFSHKYLGVTFSSNLKWHPHIGNIVSKAFQTLYFIKRICNRHPLSLVLFNSLVRPILEYSSVVWNPHLQNNISQIESVQRNFTRYFLNSARYPIHPQYIDYNERLDRLNLTTLENRRTSLSLIFLYNNN